MLVVTRKKGQSIKIADNIFINILNVDKYSNVKIGISAPKNIQIIRDDAKVKTKTI